MKFIALFCFIGFAAASSGFSALSWQSGEEYVFDYNGRMLTGLPELQSHYSGLGMKCRVHLQVQGEGKFALQVRDVEYSRVSQKLQPGGNGEHGPMTSGSSMPAGGFSGSFEESNWRNLELPSFKPVPSETAEYLRKTTVFTINEFGGVNEVVVAKDEPEWAINFKKALVVIFQTKTKEGINLESNSINGIEEEIARTEELEGLSHGESAVYGGQSAYWKTTEESVDGRCTVSYQLNELPKYMAMDVKNVIEKPELCPEGKYFELIKNKDINSCSARASFSYYKPGFFKCPTGNCDGMWSRSSITKYIACGTSRSDLKIMTIINDGELQQDLLGFKSETFLTGTNQVLKLVSKKPISGRFNKPSNPITIPSLMYQYSLAGNLAYPPTKSAVSEEEQYGYGVLEGLTHEEKKMIQEEEIAKYLPRHILATGGSKVGRNVDQEIIPQVKELIKELVQEDLNQISKDAPKRQITMKVLSLARAFGLMTKTGIETVYGELKNEFSSGKEQTIFKNVFFDCVLMGGSITDVKLIKEWILNGEVTSKVQIASLLTFLPQYVTVPTEELLNELFELIKSEKISEHFQLYSHGLLGFTTLVERACLSTNKDTGYPTFVFGKFCNQDSEIVTGKLIPYLEQELKSGSTTTEKKNLIVLTLGLLSHKRVVSVLLPVIEETYARQSGAPRFGLGGVSEEIEQIDSAEFTRFLAVYSLGKVGKQYPELVTPVLMSVYLNKGETTEVRVSAFNTILSLEPSTAVLQQIGTSTWSETDMEVLKTVNTAFYTLMKTEDMEQLSTSSATLCRKVALLYPLIKKTGGSVPTSATIFNSEYLRKLGVGYTTINNWVSSSESFIPQTIYTKVIYYMDRFQFSPIEFAARFQGIENVINVLREAITTGHVEDSTEIRREINGELEKIIRELKLKTREHKGTQGALYLSFVENLKTFVSFDAISEEAIKEKIMPLIKNPERIIELLSGEGSSELLNFQRVMDIAMSEYLIPSDMGLPIVVETHMPIVVSVNGDLNLDLSKHMPRVNMKVKALYAAQYTGWVGTICPFTQETLLTAIDEHTVFNVPAEFTVGLNIPESKLNVVVKPCQSLNGPMDVVHYHVRPYTVHQKYWNMKPMTLNQNVNYIKSRTPTMEKVIPFGQEYLGLNLRTVIKSESRFMDKTSILEKLSLYNYNPMNIVRFFWASTSLNQKGYPSLRSHEYRIIFNQAESSTKEIEFNLRIGVATKEIGTGMKYHKLAVVEGKRTILPYKVHSESLESVSGSGHVERVQKLKNVVEKLGELETATGFTMTYSVVLRGASRPRTYTYSATVATGSNRRSTTGLTQKWNLHLESENSGKKICVNGDVAMPLIPVWKINELRSTPIQYHYNNYIGFGNTCEEHTIKISGSSSTSEEQKKYSRESPEARLLEKLRSEGRPVTELSELAEKVRNQASVLDTIVFRTEYHNIPATIMKINDFTVEFFKTLWWPFLEKVEGSVVTPNGYTTGSSTVKIVFHPERETVDITLHRPSPGNQLIVWKNIRMVTPFTYVLPKVAGKPVIKSLEQAVRGNNVYPVCKLEGDYMKTFKNRTVEAKIDGCFHLLAADCGKLKEFAILVRSLSSVTGPKEVKVILETAKGASKTVLFTPMDKHSKVSGHIRVTINGSEKNLRHGDIISVEGPKTPINPMGIYGEISLSVDGVIRMTTRTFEMLFNGNKVEVEGSQLLKGKVCGVCGDYGNVKASDLRGPSKCIYSKPELLIASYKVQSEGCPRTVGKIAEELRKANEECTTIQVLPTKVLGKFGPYIPAVGGNSESEGIMSSLYGSLSGYGVESGVEGSNCELIHRNVVLHEGSRICFSRFPVVGCSSGCRGGNKVEKKISFTCLENSRAARHIERRIENGETVTELETMPESFTRTHELPKTCRPYGY